MAETIEQPVTPLSQITRELALCRERLAQLESENAHLRASAVAFGQLAERLNKALQIERRREPRQPAADCHASKSSGDSGAGSASPTNSY